MVTVLRPLSMSELLDKTFHLYRNNFVLFLVITAIPQVVVFGLRLWYATTLANGGGAARPVSILISLIAYVAIEISAAATVIAVSHRYLDRPITAGQAFAGASASMLRVVLIALAVIVAAGLGLVLLIVPGVYLWLMWSLAVPVTVLEGGGLNVSTQRSRHLTKGSRGRIFAIYLLIAILAYVITIIFQIPLGIFVVYLRGHVGPHSLPMIAVLSSAGTFLSTSLVGPLATIALTLIYYDERVRKEGFDLQLMMASLQAGPQAPAAVAAATTNP
jgi:hypothetical protein